MKSLLALIFISTFSTLALASNIPQLQCFGTEPFWGIKTKSIGSLSFDDPRAQSPKIYSKLTMKNAEGTTGDFAFQIIALDNANNKLELNIVKSECNDGMSDEVYPYNALVEFEGHILYGCCK
ncbi:MAG: hypothetical protein Q7U04_06275 [Bacteriovorax sp.]|nr:hypothetical protein [Bacteriovorax sp.]